MKSTLNPDFLILGASKAGTTSLYNYISQHPEVAHCSKKETGFFVNDYSKGIWFYKLYFLPKLIKNLFNKNYIITGEATPYYLFHPLTPKRIKKYFPDIKLIVILRNPIERAFSHYNYEVALNHETLTFEEAIKQEPERLKGELEKFYSINNYSSEKYRVHSYLKRGIYYEQLKNWFKYFDRNRFLIIKSEDMFLNPHLVFDKVCDFLGISKINNIKFKKYNERKDLTKKIKPETREWLKNYFKEYNDNLYDLIKVNFDWN